MMIPRPFLDRFVVKTDPRPGKDNGGSLRLGRHAPSINRRVCPPPYPSKTTGRHFSYARSFRITEQPYAGA